MCVGAINALRAVPTASVSVSEFVVLLCVVDGEEEEEEEYGRRERRELSVNRVRRIVGVGLLVLGVGGLADMEIPALLLAAFFEGQIAIAIHFGEEDVVHLNPFPLFRQRRMPARAVLSMAVVCAVCLCGC